jgi:hypothetical protein
MYIKNLPALILITFCFNSCTKRFYRANNTYNIATVNNNVCKKLAGKVILYAIFVDTRETHPWTSYDIFSTLDSVHKAMAWVEKIAKENNIDLSIEIQYHQNKGVIPIEMSLENETLSETLFKPNIIEGMENLDDWADIIAKRAGTAFGDDTSSVVKTKNKITDRERLIARLRDMAKTDNVALMYFINNYHQNEISLALHTSVSEKTEYAIISFKNPAVIAHEFLHLFGALDLYMTPFDRKKSELRKKVAIMDAFPNEIMAFTERPIDSLRLSSLTKYLIGWVPELDEKSKQLMFGKKIKVFKY